MNNRENNMTQTNLSLSYDLDDIDLEILGFIALACGAYPATIVEELCRTTTLTPAKAYDRVQNLQKIGVIRSSSGVLKVLPEPMPGGKV